MKLKSCLSMAVTSICIFLGQVSLVFADVELLNVFEGDYIGKVENTNQECTVSVSKSGIEAEWDNGYISFYPKKITQEKNALIAFGSTDFSKFKVLLQGDSLNPNRLISVGLKERSALGFLAGKYDAICARLSKI